MAVRKLDGRNVWETVARNAEGRQLRRRFDTAREAKRFERQLAQEREEARETGRVSPTASNVTLAAFCAEFLATHTAKPQTRRALAERLAVATKHLGHLPLADVDRAHIGRWVNEELHGYAPTTKRAMLKALRQALGAAVRDGLLARNPASDVPLPQLTRSPFKPFRSWEEVERVASHAGRYGPLIRFAARTGLRPQEWLALRAGDLDLSRSRLTVNQTVQDGRIVPEAKTSRSHLCRLGGFRGKTVRAPATTSRRRWRPSAETTGTTIPPE